MPLSSSIHPMDTSLPQDGSNSLEFSRKDDHEIDPVVSGRKRKDRRPRPVREWQRGRTRVGRSQYDHDRESLIAALRIGEPFRHGHTEAI